MQFWLTVIFNIVAKPTFLAIQNVAEFQVRPPVASASRAQRDTTDTVEDDKIER